MSKGVGYDPTLRSLLQLVCLTFPDLLLQLLSSFQDTKQVLDMMSDLMSNDIGLGESACLSFTTSEPRFDVTEERCVQVNRSVIGAVKRPHRGLRHTAS